MRFSATVLYRAGVAVIALGWVLFVVMQWVSGDWLPPAISFSQYGVGRDGWLFSVYLVAFSLGPVLIDRARPTGRLTTVLLLIGLAGCVLMAVVHTDPGGLQQSPRAKVHMVGSVFGLSMVPIGCCRSLLRGRQAPRWVPWTLTLTAAVCLILLLVSAVGVDTLGVGAATSWAWWQTAAAVAEMLLLLALVIWSNPTRGESSHTPAAPSPDQGRPGVTSPPKTS